MNPRQNVNDTIAFLKSQGGDIKITHRKNETDASGNRAIHHNVWFDHTSPEIRNDRIAGENQHEVSLFSQSSIGYTTAVLKIELNGKEKTFIGKTICGAGDSYNGNTGAARALQDIFKQLIVNLPDCIPMPQFKLTKDWIDFIENNRVERKEQRKVHIQQKELKAIEAIQNAEEEAGVVSVPA